MPMLSRFEARTLQALCAEPRMRCACEIAPRGWIARMRTARALRALVRDGSALRVGDRFGATMRGRVRAGSPGPR